MAITIALVFAGKNRMRYLLTSAAVGTDAGTLTTTGAATPDIRTDAAGGAIEALAQASSAGYGMIPAGALTQAQARELWLSDRTPGFAAGVTFAVTGQPPTAMCRLAPRTSTGTWFVDANVSAGAPILSLQSVGDGVAAAGTCYLDISVPGAVGA